MGLNSTDDKGGVIKQNTLVYCFDIGDDILPSCIGINNRPLQGSPSTNRDSMECHVLVLITAQITDFGSGIFWIHAFPPSANPSKSPVKKEEGKVVLFSRVKSPSVRMIHFILSNLGT